MDLCALYVRFCRCFNIEMATENSNFESNCKIDFARPFDISIPLDFDGPQPNAFGVEAAVSAACEYGQLVGDTRRGGSCNFERVTFIPHCNGTHTECIGHITNERIFVTDCLKDVIVPASVVTVEPKSIGGDLLITENALKRVLKNETVDASALVVRTSPNSSDKLTARYDENNIPPFFHAEAMEFIVKLGIKHLLVDLPSIDRLFDEGKLKNHRIFWNVDDGSRELNEMSRIHNTITELIYVKDEVEDGDYFLNLQIASFKSDASPSRPILFRRLLSA